jgi:predicted AAA+ superfamily ATPase
LETFSLEEIRQHKKMRLEELIITGGYPQLHAQPDLNRQDFYSSYLATYLERDVRSLLKVTDLRDFQRFIRACALRSGQLLNKSELARDVGISSPTANEWLSVLQASNQILILEPWFSNRTKSLVKSPKIYIADTGILCFLLNVKSETDLISSPMLGAIWETFVYSEMRKRREAGTEGLWFWRDKYGLEIDFLEDKGGRFELTECKWSENPSERDARNLIKVSELLGPGKVARASILSRSEMPYIIKGKDQLDIHVDVL